MRRRKGDHQRARPSLSPLEWATFRPTWRQVLTLAIAGTRSPGAGLVGKRILGATRTVLADSRERLEP
jgi:hypothetical protein